MQLRFNYQDVISVEILLYIILGNIRIVRGNTIYTYVSKKRFIRSEKITCKKMGVNNFFKIKTECIKVQ